MRRGIKIENENKIFTIPNILTMLRFAMIVPIMINLMQLDRITALIWMLISTATDLLDGFLARKLNQRSNLGRIIDPLADKLSVLIVAGYMAFSDDYHLPLWFLIFLLSRELLVLIAGLLIIRGRKIVMEASRPGKNSAFATAVAVLLYVLNLQPYAVCVLWAAFLLNLYSTWVYYQRFRDQIKLSSEDPVNHHL